MKSRNRNLLVAGGILLGAVAISVVLIMLRPEQPRTPSPPRTPIVSTVEAVPVEGALEVVGSGTVRPRAQVELAPQVGGEIVEVDPSLQTGGRFQRGTVLLRIEQADYRNAVEQARAQVAEARVALLQAEEEARIARREYGQFLERRQEGEVDGAADSAAIASGLVFREPQLEAAQAGLARARSQLADAELALSRTELRAPFDGVVLSETVDVGSFAPAGQPLATIYASDVLEVVVPLADGDAALIPRLWELRPGSDSVGPRASVAALYGRNRYRWDGFVDRAEGALAESSRTLNVVVRVPEPFRPGQPVGDAPAGDAPPLLVGQFAEVRIQGVTGDFFQVPRRAVRTDNEIWVVENGAIRIVPVTVVQRSDERVFISLPAGGPGLVAGDRVVTDGISVATEGMEVRLRQDVES